MVLLTFLTEPGLNTVEVSAPSGVATPTGTSSSPSASSSSAAFRQVAISLPAAAMGAVALVAGMAL